MFCPGLSIDATGRPVVTGGNANQRTSIYTPSTDSWANGGNLVQGRGYQASTTLSNGKTWTIGGSWSGAQGGKNGEIFDPATNVWTAQPGCTVAQMLTADAQGVYRADNHGWLFGWSNGTIFQAGPSAAMNWYGTAGSGTQSSAGKRGDDPDAMNGNAIMYDAVAGKILTVGGATSYQNVAATSNAHIVTVGKPNTAASTVTIGNMAYARAFANTAVLPNGQVRFFGFPLGPTPSEKHKLPFETRIFPANLLLRSSSQAANPTRSPFFFLMIWCTPRSSPPRHRSSPFLRPTPHLACTTASRSSFPMPPSSAAEVACAEPGARRTTLTCKSSPRLISSTLMAHWLQDR